MRDARRAVDQRFEVALRAGDSEFLERVASSIHDRDDDRGEVLAECERPDHGEERDRVHSEPAREEVTDDRDDKSDDHWDRARRPDPMCDRRVAGSPSDAACRKRRERDSD